MKEAISTFLEKNSRNKLIITSDKIESLNYIDLGVEFSKRLLDLKYSSHFAMRAKSILDEFMERSLQRHDIYKNYIAFSNPGILFEPTLRLDIQSFLNKYSRDYPLFLLWPGLTENNHLFFLDKKGLKIDLNNISHISI